MRQITFIPGLYRLVANEKKTQTRRRHRRWLKVKKGQFLRVANSGLILQATKDAYTQKLRSITADDVACEGFGSKEDFFKSWDEIYKGELAIWLSKANPEVVVLNYKIVTKNGKPQ